MPGSPPVRVVAPCLAPIERRKIAALLLLSFPSLLLEEIDKEKVIPNPQGFFSLLSYIIDGAVITHQCS